MEMVLLVDRDTEKILQASTFASSADGEHWVRIAFPLRQLC